MLGKGQKLKGTLSPWKITVNYFHVSFIACQARGGNLDDFFSHENQATPPALSLIGNQGNKADLLKCIELHDNVDPPTTVEVKVLDGAAIVNMLMPSDCRTFHDYIVIMFLLFINKQLKG